MSVNTASYSHVFHETAKNQGHKVKLSDFVMVIDGFENISLLTKQCPWPIPKSGEPIEVASIAGTKTTEAGQSIFNRQGPVSFYETEAGVIDRALAKIICNGGAFNAWVYHGNPKHYIGRKRLRDAKLVLEDLEGDFESTDQLMVITGTMHYQYYGEYENGTVKTLLGGAGQGGKC